MVSGSNQTVAGLKFSYIRYSSEITSVFKSDRGGIEIHTKYTDTDVVAGSNQTVAGLKSEYQNLSQ